MPEEQSAAVAASKNGSTLKGFLIGAFTAVAIGGMGFVGGLKFDDIKNALSAPETTESVIEPPAEETATETVQTEPTPEPVPEPAPLTQDDLQTMLTEALNAGDSGAISDAITAGANPHIFLATAAKHVTEQRGTGDTSFTHVQRMSQLLDAGVDPGETLATVAFNPYFRDALPEIARLGVMADAHAQTALEYTAANNDLEGFTALINEEVMGNYAADITANDFAALQIASENGSTYIMEYGLNWDSENNGGMFVYENGYDLLYAAMRRNDAIMVDALVEAQAHLMMPSYRLQTMFEQSAAGGHLSLFTAMIDDLGMDVTSEARLDDGTYMHSYSPTLITAAENGYVEIGRAAIAAGAHPASWKGTPAIRAAIAGHLDFVQMLREGNRPADFRMQSGEAYIQAVRLGHDNIARFMVSEQPELVDIRDGAGFNHAYRTNNIALFTFMLEQGGTAYGSVLNTIIDDNNLAFAEAVFEHVAALDEGQLPTGTWNAINHRMNDDMAALLDQYPDSIRPVLNPNAVYEFLSGPEL